MFYHRGTEAAEFHRELFIGYAQDDRIEVATSVQRPGVQGGHRRQGAYLNVSKYLDESRLLDSEGLWLISPSPLPSSRKVKRHTYFDYLGDVAYDQCGDRYFKVFDTEGKCT